MALYRAGGAGAPLAKGSAMEEDSEDDGDVPEVPLMELLDDLAAMHLTDGAAPMAD